MGGQEDLNQSLKAIMAAKRDELGEPPTPEELLAYRDGGLDPAERERMEARLAVHPGAARALADLAAFPNVEPAPGTPELSDAEIEARWEVFRKRLGEPAKPSLPRLLSPRGREERRSYLKVAAAVLVGVAAGWAAGFFSGGPARESAINVTITELSPDGTRSAASVVEVPAESEELVLVLAPPAGREYPAYEAEVVDSRGARLWAGQGLRPSAMGTFQLSFRRGVLRPGTLRVRLFGREGEMRRLLETYEVRLVSGGEAR